MSVSENEKKSIDKTLQEQREHDGATKGKDGGSWGMGRITTKPW